MSPGRRQAIMWTNAGIVLIRHLSISFCDILIAIHTFSFKRMRLKMSSGKWQPFYPGHNVSNHWFPMTYICGCKLDHHCFIQRMVACSGQCKLDIYKQTSTNFESSSKNMISKYSQWALDMFGHAFWGRFTGTRPNNSAWNLDSNDPRIDIDLTSIRHFRVGSMSNWCRCLIDVDPRVFAIWEDMCKSVGN